MPAVQRAGGAVHRELGAHDAADAEYDLRTPRLVHGPIAEDPSVGRESRRVRAQHGAQVVGAGLFLALEEELEVDRERNACGTQSVERREHGDDGGLVVACRARVEACVIVENGAAVGQGDDATVSLDRRIAQRGRPGRRRPPCGIDRLAIVVRVHDDGACRARRAKLSVDGRRRARCLELVRGDPATREHRDERVGIAPDGHAVRREVGNREEGRQLAEHGGLVPGAPVANGSGDGVGAWSALRRKLRGREQQERAHV